MSGRTIRVTDEPTAVTALRGDPHLDPLIDRHGPLRVDPADDLFRRTVVSITRQQVSMAAAEAIQSRLFDRFEMTPTAIAGTDPAALAAAGLSRTKAETVVRLADRFVSDGLSKETLAGYDDDEIRARLTDIKGIGPWTVDMQLIFVFDRPDVLPLGDLGIRRALWSRFDEDLTGAELRERTSHWAPYRTTASLYLWAGDD